MLSKNDKITNRQLQMLLILDVFGTGIIILPRRAAEYAAQDAWIAVTGAAVCAVIYGFLIITAGRMFPNDSFATYCSKVLTKPVGAIISFALAVKILVGIGLELRVFGEIMKQTMLENTPYYVVCASMLLLSAYAAAKGYETRARLAEILFFIIFIPFIVVFFIGVTGTDFSNLRPVLTTPPVNIIRGSFSLGVTFTGLEFLLLAHPYINKIERTRRSALGAICLIGVLMAAVTAVTVARFGAVDVKMQMWPVLEMMDIISLPGMLIERQDALVLSFWIISIFAVVNAGLFFSSVIMRDIVEQFRRPTVCGRGKHYRYIALCAPVAYVVSLLPRNIEQVYAAQDFIFMTFGVGFMFVVPIIIIIAAKLRGLGARHED